LAYMLLVVMLCLAHKISDRLVLAGTRLEHDSNR
jgi:hypothetical protein